jgi:hypothetical protein
LLAAPTLADVLQRAEVYGSPHPLRDRLVSIVFAEPASLVISDLETNWAFWDEMTGESWDCSSPATTSTEATATRGRFR